MPDHLLSPRGHGVGDPSGSFRRDYRKPRNPWMKQIARNLSADEGFLVGKRYLLMDRDTKFSEGFRDILQGAGVKRFVCLRGRPISMLT